VPSLRGCRSDKKTYLRRQMTNILYNLFRIAAGAAFGFIFYTVCREDNRCGKIRNALILKGLKICLAAACATALFGLAGHGTVPSDWTAGFIINAAISAFASVIMWKGGVWPAGDAKFFILSAAALPVIIPKAAYFPYTLFLSLLMNILIPAAAVFTVEAAFGFIAGVRRKGALKNAALNAVKPENVSSFLGAAAVFIVFKYARELLRACVHVNEAVFFAVMLLVWPVFSGPFKRHFKLTACAFAALMAYLAFAESSRYMLLTAFYGLSCGLPFMLLNLVIRLLMSRDSLTPLDSCAISEGVILSDDYREKLAGKFPEFYRNNMDVKYPDGLTAEQADSLKKLLASPQAAENGIVPAEGRKGRPFAVWITAGTVITVLLNGESVVALCRTIIRIINGLI